VSANIVVTAGGSGAVVDGVTSNGIQLRAQALTVSSETIIQNNVDASASIAKYAVPVGSNVPKTLEIQGWPETDPAQAEAVCDAWVLRYQGQRPQITVTLKPASSEQVRQMIELRVSDRVTVREEHSGIIIDAWVESKQIHIGTGGFMTCVLGLEKTDDITGYLWDGVTTLWDTATWGS
jgi:hypothetical protein